MDILLSVLVLYQYNFRLIHWNASGKRFKRVHLDSESYVDDIQKTIDSIAEMCARLNIKIPTFQEVVSKLDGHSETNFLADVPESVDFDKYIELTDKMLGDILKCIANVLQSSDIKDKIENVGIKANLEGIYEEYDLKYRYLNKRQADKGFDHDNHALGSHDPDDDHDSDIDDDDEDDTVDLD